jgi:lysophospholipase L1-like esterase
MKVTAQVSRIQESESRIRKGLAKAHPHKALCALAAATGLACLAVAASRASAEEPVALVKPGERIVVFGDSISGGNGYGFHAVQFLNQEHPDWKLNFVSSGYAGWTAKRAATVIDKVLAAKPDVVTIMFGTNDLGLDGSRGAGEFKERIRALVRPLKEAGVRVILLTTPFVSGTSAYGREWRERCLPRMGDEVIALAREEGLPVFDMFLAMQELHAEGRKNDPQFCLFNTPDDCHPNARGHQLMGRALADFLAGKPQTPRPPFLWTGTKPAATAGHVDRPLDLAAAKLTWPAASTPMILDKLAQIADPAPWTAPADLAAVGTAAWDKENLYLRVEVTDPVVVIGPKQPAWGYDGIEFYFDTRPADQRDVISGAGYFQFMVAVTETNGAAVAACGKGTEADVATLKAFSRKTDKGYVITLAVPWTALGFTPATGANLGFDYTVINKNEPKGKDYIGLWRGAGNNWINAGNLGILTFQ